MIGVLARPEQHPIVREFFELFKTAWEFYEPDHMYDVVLCNGCPPLEDISAPLTVIYSGRRLPLDDFQQVTTDSASQSRHLQTGDGLRLPLYCSSLTFGHGGLVLDARSGQPAAYVIKQPGGHVAVRLGYDLFDEVAFLLSQGQPPPNSSIPALEVHVSVLRDCILSHGLPLTEVPPVPDGYKFIACLTHDIDHGSIRKHVFDHTMFGFLYRALVGSALDVLRGRRSPRDLLTNWFAALKLPLVYFGFATDFWNDFGTYAKLESEGRSTFFVVPFAGCTGVIDGHSAPAFRATKYCAKDVAPQLRKLISSNNEISLHGIDAWHDVELACKELQEVQRVTVRKPVGVRMHWLYFDQNSPRVLEQAGFQYDSSMGYNDTLGYRNGTAQVFKPLTAERLLELPLHVMDTALFSSGIQSLSFAEAKRAVNRIIDNAERFGGVVTINWHDRSIAPERLWGDFYNDLLTELRSRGAWLASAGDTVRWFEKRRSFDFHDSASPPEAVFGAPQHSDLPSLFIRTHAVADPISARATA